MPYLAKSSTELNVSKLVALTNRAQAVAITLANEPLLSEKARVLYNEANEVFKRALNQVMLDNKVR